ncbi:MerR HTH family regulatory protein [Cribrihabitans marinus]|uniref:MerR HTH family regulatory protein n=1 Tax=Cribrihabitans marinus TaxID=1227549 RepID=A0A1H6QS57_9RHOB|nr:MerR family transcriptional regulator [Cribrihabitans marinus]GGH19713.1 MerR family transcriptional regulator [Cribrihabitans marinus]SEI46449.1 MerR HTH family regulatory protein [Cribrihabitans marinus]
MSKSPDAFRTISEVAEWLGVQAHVLRFWESKFSQIRPVKRAGGRRYYRPNDMLLIGGIKKMLHDDGLTIKGVQKILREQGIAHVQSVSQSLEESAGDDLVPGGTVIQFKDRMPIQGDRLGDAADTGSVIDLTATEEVESGETPATAQTAGSSQDRIASDRDEPEVESPETPADTATPEDATPPPRPRVIDLPDPPAEADIRAAPGALSHLAGLDRLNAARAQRIAPLAAALRNWLDQQDIGSAG